MLQTRPRGVSRGDDGPPLLIVDSPTAAQFGGSVTMLVMKVPSDGIDLCSQNLIFFNSPGRSLRSRNEFLVKQKSVKQSRSNGKSSKVLCKDRAFENLGPKLFNELPLEIRSSQTVTTFKNRLKTHLFRNAFNC